MDGSDHNSVSGGDGHSCSTEDSRIVDGKLEGSRRSSGEGDGRSSGGDEGVVGSGG